MAELKLYREIYQIVVVGTANTYSLTSAYTISAQVYNGAVLIESPTVIIESTGVYYVSLNPILYSFDYIYDLKWNIKYTQSAPVKQLTARFKMQPNNIVYEMDYQIGINGYPLR